MERISKIPYGYCECGCGQKTTVSKWNNRNSGYVAGEPRRFIRGHSRRSGGPIVDHNGYERIRQPEHPRADLKGYIYYHVMLAEKALGYFLPYGAEIHHIDEDTKNNNGNNLVICQDRAYHKLIHKRTRALNECGNANWKKCWICKKWDDHKKMHPNGEYHRRCMTWKNGYYDYLNKRAHGE